MTPQKSKYSTNEQVQNIVDQSNKLVKKWLEKASRYSEGKEPQIQRKTSKKSARSAELLAGTLKDPRGLDFTVGFVDQVVRPEDTKVAAQSLKKLTENVPEFLPWYMKTALKIGGNLAPVLPDVVIPISRKVLRNMVGHLIVDARPEKLDTALAEIKDDETNLNINLLGEAVLGDKEANQRLKGTFDLLKRDDVDYVSIKVSSIVSQLNMWAFEETVDHIVEKLKPLYLYAAQQNAQGNRKFINLDMEEYRDLNLTIATFKKLLADPELKNMEAGIVLQAYLPDALSALQEITEFSKNRVNNGGAGVKVRLVKGANLAMEKVEAAMHDWPLATYATKQDSDTNYLRVMDWALNEENMAPNAAGIAPLRLGIAGHNLFDIAFAHLLAEERNVKNGIEFEMLLGMAEEQAAVMREDLGSILLYTPVVHPEHFDVAISYLIRRLEENASQENFMSAIFDIAENPRLFDREKQRFENSIEALTADTPDPHRVQEVNRIVELDPFEFENSSDSDPSIENIRTWGRETINASKNSHLGNELLEKSFVDSLEEVDELYAKATKAHASWATMDPTHRAEIIRNIGRELAKRRSELIEVAASETGKTIAEGDVEISEAIDFANFYASETEKLAETEGAEFVPAEVTVVVPPWNFPVAIPAGTAIGPLASGSSVIMKPAPQARRTGAVIAEAIWAAGVPRDAFQFVDVPENETGKYLISHDKADRVILTGAYDTAQLFTSWRQDLPLLAETSGKNSIIVMPGADYDIAANDVVNSAFSHAGQKCSAASLVILVGSAATSQRFRDQLVDAAQTLKVGYPQDLESKMGPVIEPVSGKLKNAMTQLEDGEKWVLQPEQLDDTGRLFSPGIRENVKPGSYFHMTEFFGPALAIMTADSLEEALEIQNATAYGLTAGLHTISPEDVEYWSDNVQAGNLYVNRGITGAIVRRQPFGGWKRSAIGAGTKAGGPNYLASLGGWKNQPLTDSDLENAPKSQSPSAQKAVDSLKKNPEHQHGSDYLDKTTRHDQKYWDKEFGVTRDISDLGVERNIFRYHPAKAHIRIGKNASEIEGLRVALAAQKINEGFGSNDVTISSAQALEPALAEAFAAADINVDIIDDEQWFASLKKYAPQAENEAGMRLRIVLDPDDTTTLPRIHSELSQNPEVAIYAGPVTESSRVEMLPFVKEQSVTVKAHRFGTPDPLASDVLVDTVTS